MKKGLFRAASYVVVGMLVFSFSIFPLRVKAASGTWGLIATSLGELNFTDVASSSNGRYLAATTFSGPIYTSNDYGATWTERNGAGTQGWSGITMSEDGSKLAIIDYPGKVHTSNDYGATWTEHTSVTMRPWNWIAGSADGSKLLITADASSSMGGVAFSSDGGETWTSLGTGDFGPSGMSDDGRYMAYYDPSESGIIMSTDGGENWGSPILTDGFVSGIDFSADGSKIVVLDNYEAKVSDTSAISWTNGGLSGVSPFDVVMDESGQNIAIASSGDYGVMTSEDYGVTWAPGTMTNGLDIRKITSNYEGDRLLAAGSQRLWVNQGPIEMPDYNNDGILDEDQPNVSGYRNSDTGKIVAIDVGGDCELAVDDMTSEDQLDSQDPAYNFEGGLWEYEADCPSGATTTIKLYYYDTSSAGKVVRKYTPNINGYFNLNSTHGLTIEEQTIDGSQVTVVTFQIQDGGVLDDDKTADGTIIDPVGLASQILSVPNTGILVQ